MMHEVFWTEQDLASGRYTGTDIGQCCHKDLPYLRLHINHYHYMLTRPFSSTPHSIQPQHYQSLNIPTPQTKTLGPSFITSPSPPSHSRLPLPIPLPPPLLPPPPLHSPTRTHHRRNPHQHNPPPPCKGAPRHFRITHLIPHIPPLEPDFIRVHDQGVERQAAEVQGEKDEGFGGGGEGGEDGVEVLGLQEDVRAWWRGWKEGWWRG